MERIPKPGECYRHFKNKLYQIIAVAEHSETGEKMVVYQALYGTFGTYVRPLSLFTDKVDHEKHPQADQEYRFELVNFEAAAEGEESVEEAYMPEKALAMGNDDNNTPPSKNLLAFLDAKTYDAKLAVLKERHDLFTEKDLEAICESLDIGSGDGREAMYRASENYLEMQLKYDGVRLR